MSVVRPWALLLLAGCIEPSYRRCGDYLCAAEDRCLLTLHTCASPAQQEACDGVPGGEPCAVGGGVGRCQEGACIPEGCGNGVVDFGEICDDGGQRDGDGCSGDCRSAETCGNGIIDRVAGEDCDCGTADNKPGDCTLPNTDDLAGECSPTCKGRCGDGVIRGGEQCDSSNLDGVACSDVGFYRGELACSSRCLFDVTSCAGTCGDGVADVTSFEACDGAPVAGACVAAGWDAGSAGCTSTCRPDTTYCNRFGWRAVEPVVAMDAWSDASGTVIVTAGGTWVRDAAGMRHNAPSGGYLATAGGGGVMYAVGGNSIAMWNGTAWSALTPPAANINMRDAWADASELWVSASQGDLWKYAAGAWTQYLWGSVLMFNHVAGSSTRICAMTGTGVYCMDRTTTSWTQLAGLTSVGIVDIAVDGAIVWVAARQGLYVHAGVSWFRISTTPAVAVTAHPAGGVIARLQTGTVWFSGNVERHLGSIAPAGYDPYALAYTGGELIAAGPDGVYRLVTGPWISASVATTGEAIVNPSGSRTIGDGAVSYDGLSYQGGPMMLDATTLLDAPAVGTFDDAGTLKAATSIGIYYKAGSYWQQEGSDTTEYSCVEYSNGHVLLCADPNASPAIRDYTAATTISTGTDTASSVARDDAGNYYIATGQTVKRWTGSTWTTVLAMPAQIQDLWVAGDGDITAVAGTQVGHVKGGATLPVVDLGVPLYALSGTAADDIFAAGGALAPLVTGLFWFDGQSWTPVALPTLPTNPIGALAVNASLVLYIDEAGVHELTRLGTWLRP